MLSPQTSSDACPLCRHETVLVERIAIEDLDAEYRRQLQISVRQEFPTGVHELRWLECKNCGLAHFSPLTAGSSDFYASLAARPDYYTTDRWEFGEVAARLQPEADLVDVGCGDGVFLRMAPSLRKCGLEFNPEAAARGRAAGLDIAQAPLDRLAPHSADVITAFQVIEHVDSPAAFLADAVRVLRPGGRLFLSAPDEDAYIGSALHDPLNAPPHHLLRWRDRALRQLEHLLPLTLVQVDRESLDPRLLYAYRRAQAAGVARLASGGRLPRYRVSRAMTLLRRTLNVAAKAAVRLAPRVPSHAVGPTILAEFRRQ